MISIILFLVVIGTIGIWWASRQRLAAKPWLEQGILGEFPETESLRLPATQIGLGIFLAIVGCLFALLISAYLMRMDMADWRSVPPQTMLWPVTGTLIMSSVALEWAKLADRRGQLDGVRISLLASGLFTIAFLAGQLLVLRQLTKSGHLLAGNPANSFFFLIVGLHGLHVVGGLVALGRTIDSAWREQYRGRLRLRLSLCATYWHFLLAIWFMLFALLTGWAEDFVAICRQLLN
jgi:cytochrome c oxidase subunit III